MTSRPLHRSHRTRLTLEPLEGRSLLSATVWTVSSLGDTGTGSGRSGDLRYCITQADKTTGNNTIHFAVTGMITLNSALPDMSNTSGVMDIKGPGAASLTVARNSASGTPDFRIFKVDANVQAKLAGLTITGGRVDGGDGGGIENSGTLIVSNSAIDSNTASESNGSGGHGGGIYSDGTLTISASTIDSNSCSNGGGGIENFGTMAVSASTIAHNSSSFEGGGIGNFGTMTVIDSAIADNSSTASYGGGINNEGSGIPNDFNQPTLTLINSTVANNSAYSGGGGIVSNAVLIAVNSTIAYNNDITQGYGGGLYAYAVISLDNTIVALNTSGSGSGAMANDIFGPGPGELTGSYNLIGTGGSGGLINGVNGNQVGVANPGLGPLAYYGGPTQTIALLAGSPAIDKGSNALAVDPTTGKPLTTDQRGPGFVRIYNSTVDIGAYEYQHRHHGYGRHWLGDSDRAAPDR